MAHRFCCSQWFAQLEPRVPRAGTFDEEHACPTCRTLHAVTFKGSESGSGELVCVAVAHRRKTLPPIRPPG